MMRVCAALALVLLAACDPGGGGETYVSEKQQPSNTEPGIHVSGHANVGVKRTF